jgi:cell shape-determining protein MreC
MKYVSIAVGVAIMGAVFLVMGGNIFYSAKGSVGRATEGTVRASGGFFASIIRVNDLEKEIGRLTEENQALKAKILEASKAPLAASHGAHTYTKAHIYSTYPFNNRGLVTLNAGSEEGIAIDMPVLIGQSILFGQIVETFPHYSVARTVFDPGWEIPVKVGNDNRDALMAAGRAPRLTMIVKEHTIREGDVVYSAIKDFPYGLTIGLVGPIVSHAKDAFQEADLRLAYDLGSLSEVYILTE